MRTTRHPALGHALWVSNPRYPDKPMQVGKQVGDVGFIRTEETVEFASVPEANSTSLQRSVSSSR